MTKQAHGRLRRLNFEIGLKEYPVGPVEDIVAAALADPDDREPGYRTVSVRKELPDDPIPILRRFHRAPEGSVVLTKRVGKEGMKILASPRPAQLEEVLQRFGEQIDEDVYFSINAFYRSATLKRRHLSHLNALYVDVDFHDPETSKPRPVRMNEAAARAEASRLPGKALSAVWEAQDELLIPPPSLLALSGRGIWLFYLLVDPKTGLPPQAFPEKIDLYTAVNRELQRRLTAFSHLLPADPKATDASRITRLPGSRHAAANRQVRYYVQADHRGRGLVYGLREIAELMGLNPNTGLLRPLKSEKRVPARKRGWDARWTNILDDLAELERRRKGFREGCRHHALWVTAYVMRKLGRKPDQIEDAVLQRASKCRPRIEADDALLAMSAAVEATRATASNIRSEVVRAWLNVTAREESAMKSLVSAETQQARQGPRRDAAATERRAYLAKLIADDQARSREPRSVRDFAFALSEAGLAAGKSTIGRDLKALGFEGEARSNSKRKP